MTTQKIWILGYGKFGRFAVDKIKRVTFGKADLVVVDLNQDDFEIDNVKLKCCEAIDWLCCAMTKKSRADWIVPAIPIHVAGEFLHRKLAVNFSIEILPIPDRLISMIPFRFIKKIKKQGKEVLLISYADWICPDNCYQPASTCTATGNSRPEALFRFLEKIEFEGYKIVLIRSKQLLAGLGGYRPKDLDLAINKIRRYPGSRFILATACKCHGIVEFLSIN